MAEQLTFFNSEYDEFVEKFKIKKTTDDCYTPPNIYSAILEWVEEKYGIDPSRVVRPFVPGGDFENYLYAKDAVVVDNPPFSILAKIIDFYCLKKIKFFLFAPSLTLFAGGKNVLKTNHIVCDAEITYHNGAKVKTAFVTNLSQGIVAQTASAVEALAKSAVEKVADRNIRSLSINCDEAIIKIAENAKGNITLQITKSKTAKVTLDE